MIEMLYFILILFWRYELFYDLVFVASAIQMGNLLKYHIDWDNIYTMMVLFMVMVSYKIIFQIKFIEIKSIIKILLTFFTIIRSEPLGTNLCFIKTDTTQKIFCTTHFI